METVPATSIMSAWRGEKRSASAPKRARSKREATAPIISIAQQASPIGKGHSEFLRPQSTIADRRVVIALSPSACSV